MKETLDMERKKGGRCIVSKW